MCIPILLEQENIITNGTLQMKSENDPIESDTNIITPAPAPECYDIAIDESSSAEYLVLM